MKKEKNIISTKDELIKNFSKEQLEVYNYYKSKFSYAENNAEMYPITKEDKEIAFLEKSCTFLTTFLKIELICTLVIVTCAIMFNGIPDFSASQIKYQKQAITMIDEQIVKL